MHSAYKITHWGTMVNKVLPLVMDVNEHSQSGPEYPYLCLLTELHFFPSLELSRMVTASSKLLSEGLIFSATRKVALMVTFLNAFPDSAYSKVAKSGKLERYTPGVYKAKFAKV